MGINFWNYSQNHAREENCSVSGVVNQLCRTFADTPHFFPDTYYGNPQPETGVANPLLFGYAASIASPANRPQPVLVFGGNLGPFEREQLLALVAAPANLVYFYFDFSLPYFLRREQLTAGRWPLLESQQLAKLAAVLGVASVKRTTLTELAADTGFLEPLLKGTGFHLLIVYGVCPALWKLTAEQGEEVAKLAAAAGLWPPRESFDAAAFDRLLEQLPDGRYLLAGGQSELKEKLLAHFQGGGEREALSTVI